MSDYVSRKQIIHTDLDGMISAIKDPLEPTKNLYKHISIWTGQIDELVKGDGYPFATPSIFIEYQLGEGKQIGAQMTSYPNAQLILHIYHVYLNERADSGKKLNRNLPVMIVVDETQAKLQGKSPRFCSNFMCNMNNFDYKHSNVYKYSLGFKFNFLDSKGSIFDPNSGAVWATLNNPDIETNIKVETGL